MKRSEEEGCRKDAGRSRKGRGKKRRALQCPDGFRSAAAPSCPRMSEGWEDELL